MRGNSVDSDVAGDKGKPARSSYFDFPRRGRCGGGLYNDLCIFGRTRPSWHGQKQENGYSGKRDETSHRCGSPGVEKNWWHPLALVPIRACPTFREASISSSRIATQMFAK